MAPQHLANPPGPTRHPGAGRRGDRLRWRSWGGLSATDRHGFV